MIICSELGHSSCVKLLLQFGANVNQQDRFGRSSLHYAIFGESSSMETSAEKNEYKAIIEQILSVQVLNLRLMDNKRRWTCLFQAVGGGSIEIVDLLINSGLAVLDTIDVKGDSLLHVAVRYNRSNVLQYLLTNSEIENEWNLLHKNKYNETPLKLAVLCKYIQCIKVLIIFGKESRKSIMKALLLAVKINCVQIVKVLVSTQFNIDPNFSDKDEMTPLRWSAYNGYKSIVKQLILAGARDDLDRFGQNIVFYAATNNHLHILKLLQKANASFNVVNYEGQSATDKTNHQQTIQFILNVRNQQLNQKQYQ